MIIGYDFWCDNVYPLENVEEVLLVDNDGVSFDTCNPISSVSKINIKNGIFDELEIFKDSLEIDTNIEQSTGWNANTLLLAKFNGDLIGGTVGINGYDVTHIQFLKRKVGETEWNDNNIYKEIEYDSKQSGYQFVDKFIESEQEYEYAVRPICYVTETIDDAEQSLVLYGAISLLTTIYTTFDYAHLMGKDDNDNMVSYMLPYNVKLGDIASNINANIITTLSGQYPVVVYGESDYRSGNVSCLLVTEESATGSINVGTEKILRNNINKFLSNKKPKIFKYEDGTYMLISISDNYTLTPNENLLGSYSLTFNYVEIGDANDINTLHKCNLLE